MDDSTWVCALSHRDRLLGIARAKGLPTEDAEDVVQEALARCAEFESLDVERIGPFLTTVTLRLCADVHRRNEEPQRAKRWLVPTLHHEPDPADVVCRDHGAEWVASLLKRLPERQRRVLSDRARGMSIQQIARHHGLTYKAVESALSRARATVRSALATSMSAAGALVRAPRVRRIATATSSGIVITAVVVATTPSSTPEPRALAPPPGQAMAVGAPPLPGQVLPGPSPLTTPVTLPLPTATPVVQDIAVNPGTPGPNPLPTFAVTAGPIAVERHEDGYGLVSGPMRCVRYGIQVKPYPACRYPDENTE